MPALYEVSIKALISQEEKVLLLARHSFEGDLFWDLPGGRLDEGESYPDALKREFAEEINFSGEFEIGEPVGVQLWDDPLWDGPGKFIVYLPVQATISEIKLSAEHAAYRWVGLDDLPAAAGEHRLEEELQETLLRFLSGKR